MGKTLKDWLQNNVEPVRERSMSWLSERYFFRDPSRPLISDTGYFYAPADGIVLYVKVVSQGEQIVSIKGEEYTLSRAMGGYEVKRDCLVIGIFMTFYDIHINRIPYAGRLCYQELEPLKSYNCPMIDVEKELLGENLPDLVNAEYLLNNQRVINRVYSHELRQYYYILQIADYDVDCITPFCLKQNRRFPQNSRFSQIRYGSQVDLIIPLSDYFKFEPIIAAGIHVEAGVDRVVKITKIDSEKDRTLVMTSLPGTA